MSCRCSCLIPFMSAKRSSECRYATYAWHVILRMRVCNIYMACYSQNAGMQHIHGMLFSECVYATYAWHVILRMRVCNICMACYSQNAGMQHMHGMLFSECGYATYAWHVILRMRVCDVYMACYWTDVLFYIRKDSILRYSSADPSVCDVHWVHALGHQTQFFLHLHSRNAIWMILWWNSITCKFFTSNAHVRVICLGLEIQHLCVNTRSTLAHAQICRRSTLHGICCLRSRSVFWEHGRNCQLPWQPAGPVASTQNDFLQTHNNRHCHDKLVSTQTPCSKNT